jgi:hypothetical protein
MGPPLRPTNMIRSVSLLVVRPAKKLRARVLSPALFPGQVTERGAPTAAWPLPRVIGQHDGTRFGGRSPASAGTSEVPLSEHGECRHMRACARTSCPAKRYATFLCSLDRVI